MIKELLDLFYPPLCVCCDGLLLHNMQYLCLNCRSDLHRTNYHLLSNNPVEKHFRGRLAFEKATSFLHFKNESKTQKIMHALKYQGQKELGEFMGRLAAIELTSSGFFEGIDLLVPIPMHPAKLRKRGYNQAEMIAKGISLVTNIHLANDLLIKVVTTESQTKKSRLERFENVRTTFALNDRSDSSFNNVLLVDDVITTGSTIEAAGQILMKTFNCKLNVLTLAATD